MSANDTPMQLLFVTALQRATGNKTSIERISRHLESECVSCHLANSGDFEDRNEFIEYIKKQNITAVVGLHAYRAGRLLTDCPIPYGMVLGGTDVNEFYKNADKLVVMTAAVKEARFVVTYCAPMYQQALSIWPDIKDKLYQQRHAVITSPSSFDFHKHLHQQCNIDSGSCIFLLVAGIRPVKDPLYVVEAFSEWHIRKSRVHLVIVGPELDPEYTKKVKSTVENLPGVHLIHALPQPDVHAAISQSYALINSSLSEGMPQAVLEAMMSGVPVIVRDIPVNAAIVKHNSSGLLFNTPQEFIKQAERLVDSEELCQHLVSNAKEYVTHEHSLATEKKTYIELVSLLQS
ncbi:glycosyltransferase 1 domain-containing protein 1-like [Glandiceps talaboti]